MELKHCDEDPSSFTRWWGKETTSIVTGANRGIGFAVAKRLAELGVTVILTARDASKGVQAMELLKSQGLGDYIHFSALDISQPQSITAFASWFNHKFGVLDILNVRNPETKATLEDVENLSEEVIEEVVNSFLKHVKQGVWENEGWPEHWTDYSVSKLALNAYSKLLAKELENCNITVNCFCPGFTQTGMTGGKGSRSADIAANIAAKLALLPPHYLPTGRFVAGQSMDLRSRF
ncbi:hypothetical protein KSS87_010568 [Heliosperma pusillum]|nr:hypothetical protein KSS87_010568 [Heliosperma pusillum]